MSQNMKFGFLLLLTITPIISATNFTLSELQKSNLTWQGKFDRNSCYHRTQGYLDDRTLVKNREVFFYDDSNKTLLQNDPIALTLPACRVLCGGGQDWYWDSGPRISSWLFPLLLLISNVELSPLDKRRFFAIIHLIGDPIDSMWSLVHKIDAWDQCHTLATNTYANSPPELQRVVATVFAGFEEVTGPYFTSDYLLETLIHADPTQEPNGRHWRMAAIELADSRSDEILRTTLAIVLYFYQVIASFIEQVGGTQSSPPGGRIGTAMFISWLVPVVLLSNTVGGFTSRRSAFNVVTRFASSVGLPLDFVPPSQSTHLGQSQSHETDYFESLGWSGAIYTFRTWKTGYLDGEVYRWRTALIFCTSIAPIVIGMTGSFIIIWNTLPIGFTCRHFWVIGVFTSYFISAFITWVSKSDRFATGSYHWHFVLYKDGVFGLTSLFMIFLSSAGLFNSCYCFSGVFQYHSESRVVLDSDPFYERKNKTLYPAVVAICLSLQLAVFAGIVWRWWKGLQVMRWSEGARAEEWRAAGGNDQLAYYQNAADAQSQHSVELAVPRGAQQRTGMPIEEQPHRRPLTA